MSGTNGTRPLTDGKKVQKTVKLVTSNHEYCTMPISRSFLNEIDITDSLWAHAEKIKKEGKTSQTTEEIFNALAGDLAGYSNEANTFVGVSYETKFEDGFIATDTMPIYNLWDIAGLAKKVDSILDLCLVNAKQNAAAKEAFRIFWNVLRQTKMRELSRDRSMPTQPFVSGLEP